MRSARPLLVLLPLLLSCVVLKPNEVERRNSPPTVVSPARARALGRSLDQIITFDVSPGAQLSIELPVVVDDPEGDTLEARVFLDYDADSNTGIELNGFSRVSTREGPAEQIVTIPRRDFVPGSCVRVELIVTSAFAASGDGGIAARREPASPGDATRVVWWMQIVDDFTTIVPMSVCPQ